MITLPCLGWHYMIVIPPIFDQKRGNRGNTSPNNLV